MSEKTIERAGKERLLVRVGEAAHMANCSPRHFQRLVDAGVAPSPIRLGSLVRWQKTAIEEWIRQGCPEQGGPAR